MKLSLSVAFIGLYCALMGCGSSGNIQERTQFTRLDSLTDEYLVLQDSVLQSWNRVVKTETDRSRVLKALVQQLAHSANSPTIESLQTQVAQLEKIRFTPKSISNPHVVDEYDEACKNLLEHIHQLSEKAGALAHSEDFMQQVQSAERASLKSFFQRARYDSLASSFNAFVESNWNELKEIERNAHLERKPLFNNVASQR